MEEDLTFISDYDFFELKRREKFAEISEYERRLSEKVKRDRQQSIRSALVDGPRVLLRLQSTVSDVHKILYPYDQWKLNIQLFLEHIEGVLLDTATSSRYNTRHRCYYSSKILLRCKPLTLKYYRSKTNLVEWKMLLMKAIRDHHKLNRPHSYVYVTTPSPLRLARHLLRLSMHSTKVDRSICRELRIKRNHFRAASKKLKLIHDTQVKCRGQQHCTNREHLHPRGCYSCGVVYQHGMLGGAVPYVESISRDTGVATLVTLDFEIETLIQEDMIQTQVVETARDDLQRFEEKVYRDIRVAVQSLWVAALVWKRAKRQQSNLQRSHHRYRHRRLLALKRDGDALIAERPPFDQHFFSDVYNEQLFDHDVAPYMRYFRHKYCDLLRPAEEHLKEVVHRKQLRVLRVARALHRVAWDRVCKERERKYQEWLRLQSLPKPERPIVFRKVSTRPLGADLICYRTECRLRTFLTEERYRVHMSVHARLDVIREQKIASHRAAKKVRDAREAEFMDRVGGSRTRLVEVNQAYGYELELDGVDHNSRAMMEEMSMITGGSEINYDGESLSAFSPLTGGDHQTGSSSSSIIDSFVGSPSPSPSFVETVDTASSHSEERYQRGVGYARMKTKSRRSSVRSPDSSSSIIIIDSDSITTASGASITTSSMAENNRRLAKQLQHARYQLVDLSRDVLAHNAQTTRDMRQWNEMHHLGSLHSLFNLPMYSLELVSKHGEVDVARQLPLDKPLVRFGTHSTCECVISLRGATLRDKKVAKVHCLFYCPMVGNSSTGSVSVIDSLRRDDGAVSMLSAGPVTLVDNSSVYGTYTVSAIGTRKVPTKMTAGVELSPGMLVCIGVCRDGPASITASQANQACVVYRVRCIDQEIL